jgi:putative oxidoreductase
MNLSSTALISNRGRVDFAVLKYAELAGRVLLIALFVLAGLRQLPGYAGTARMMAAHGVPAALLPLVILTELGGGLAVVVGWQTRIAAFLLAGYTLLTALIFHGNFANAAEAGVFRQHLSIIGGFLILMANGAGPISLDYWRSSRAMGRGSTALKNARESTR